MAKLGMRNLIRTLPPFDREAWIYQPLAFLFLAALFLRFLWTLAGIAGLR